jgi:hypothetical protein
VSIQDNRFREVPRRSNEAEEIAIIAELLCAPMRRFSYQRSRSPALQYLESGMRNPAFRSDAMG